MSERQEMLTQTLVTIEDEAWQALTEGTGAEFYEGNLAPEALMVFPFGILDRSAAIGSLRDVPPWAAYEMVEPQVISLSESSALLTYLATAQRAGAEPYTAYMTTVFVKDEAGWKTAFHQQTPRTE